MYCHIHHCHYHHCRCVPKDSKENGKALTQEELVAYTQEMKEELKDYTVNLKDQIFSYIDIGVNPVEIANTFASLKEQDTYILRTLTNTIDELNNTTNLSMYNLRARVTNLEGQSASIIQELNSLPFEGGVLADTFVTVENTLNQRQLNRGLSSVDEMLAIVAPTTGLKVTVNSYHADKNKGGGDFIYDAAMASTNDGGNVINGWVRDVNRNYLNVYNFGAFGDGSDNPHDDLAFKRIAGFIKSTSDLAYVMHIPLGDFVVGKQEFTAGVGFTNYTPFSVDYSVMTNKYIAVKSDNAVIRLRSGLYYGTFDKQTKERFDPPMPFQSGTPSYTQYGSSVSVGSVGFILRFNNIKGLHISGNLKLDGNRVGTIIGGRYGDQDWQIGSGGLYTTRIESIYIENVTSNNHVQDGFYIAGCNSSAERNTYNPEYKGEFHNLVGLYNSRQGMSLVGGKNLTFYSCVLSETATPDMSVRSAPRSSLDIEPELSPCRNIQFFDCYFGHCASVSLNASTADSKHVTFTNCTFINRYGNAIWVDKPAYTFNGCRINGVIIKVPSRTNVDADKCVFNKCVITDDPNENPDFVGAEYMLQANGSNAIFNDCVMDYYIYGGLYSRGAVEFNNLHYTLRTNVKFAVNDAIVTIRMKDLRPSGSSNILCDFNRCKGVIVVDKVEGAANNLSGFGVTFRYNEVGTYVADHLVYLPTQAKASSVTNATAEDVVAKFNSLLSSMKAAGLMT